MTKPERIAEIALAVANATRWNAYCQAELPRIVQCDKVPCPMRERCVRNHLQEQQP